MERRARWSEDRTAVDRADLARPRAALIAGPRVSSVDAVRAGRSSRVPSPKDGFCESLSEPHRTLLFHRGL